MNWFRMARPSLVSPRTCAEALRLSLMALLAPWLGAASVDAQVTSELASPTFAEGSGAYLGAGLDIEGDYAVLAAPGTKELHFYTRSIQTGAWNQGLTIDLSNYEAVGSAVALGDDLTIYYVVATSFDPVAWQLRRRTLSINGGIDASISPYTDIQMPASLDVRGDLMILGWRPLLVEFRGSLVNAAGYEVRERIAGNFVTVESEFIQPENVGVSRLGWAVATDGTRFAVTDPQSSTHGSVQVWAKNEFGQWAKQQTVLYNDPFQASVHFGSSVAIDGDCLAVGMEDYNRGFFTSAVADAGGAALFKFGPTGWTATQTVSPSASLANDHFGRSVALRGNRLLVASDLAQRTNLEQMGDVSFFYDISGSCTGSDWQELKRLRSLPLVFTPTAQGFFGAAVELNAAGDAVVGDPFGPTGEGHGRGYVFDTAALVDEAFAIFSDGFESGNTSQWQ